MRRIQTSVKQKTCKCGQYIAPGNLYELRCGKMTKIGFRCLGCHITYPKQWKCRYKVTLDYHEALMILRDREASK